jgi:hyperosmotically inducible protein
MTGSPAGTGRQEQLGGRRSGAMNFKLKVVCVFAALLAMSHGAFAQDRRDVKIADEIGRVLSSYTRLTIFDDISATVENGAVAITGKVTMPYKKDDLGKRIAAIDGVHSMRNEIGVLPVSQYDDQLRYRVARAIYGNSSFWNYAAMANPPIHIIVEGGRVTLAGVVNSNVERMLARSLATGLGELSVTNALRIDAETRTE